MAITVMSLTFEQAREILADDLAFGGDSRSGKVAPWGWENDDVFVLAFDNMASADSNGDSDEAANCSSEELDPDNWGSSEDLQNVREHIQLVPAGWDPWEDRPAEVPVVEKATGRVRWEIPRALGEPVAPNLRPVGQPIPGTNP